MADDDAGKTFELVECPSELIGYLPLLNDLRSRPFDDETLVVPYSKGGTGQLIGRLTDDKIDVAMCETFLLCYQTI